MWRSCSERGTNQLPSRDVAPRAPFGRRAPNLSGTGQPRVRPCGWGSRGQEGPVCRSRALLRSLPSCWAGKYRSCRLCLPTPSPWVSASSRAVSPTWVQRRFAWLMNNSAALCSPRSLPVSPGGRAGYLPRGRWLWGHVISTRSVAAARGRGCLAGAEGCLVAGTVPGAGGVSGCRVHPGRERSWVLRAAGGGQGVQTGDQSHQLLTHWCKSCVGGGGSWGLRQSWVETCRQLPALLPPATPSSLRAGPFPLPLRLLSMPVQEGFPKAPAPAPCTRTLIPVQPGTGCAPGQGTRSGHRCLALCHACPQPLGFPVGFPARPLAVPEPHLRRRRGCGEGGW